MKRRRKQRARRSERDFEEFRSEREARTFQSSLVAQGMTGAVYGETRDGYRVLYPATTPGFMIRNAKGDVKRVSSRPPPMRDSDRSRLTRQEQKWASEKIRILREEGYPERQAVAIGLSMARRRRRRARVRRR